jgi:predicted dehydrogenase
MKIGIIGIGYWGPNVVRNFLAQPQVKGVVCWDISENQLKRVKTKFPSVEIAASLEDLLKRSEVEAIAIVTPVSTHHALGMKCLEAGKHLLLEKPMAASSREADELIESAEKRGRILMVDHTFLYTGAVRKIKEMIDDGDLGDLYYFDSVRVNLGLFQHDTNVIWDLAPHDVSIMSYLINQKPVTVSAVGVSHFNGLEDVAYLTVMFENNLVAHFHINWLSPVKIRRILIGGSKHMVVYNDMEASEKVKVYDKGVEMRTAETVYQALVQYRIGDMYSPTIDQTEALSLMTSEFISSIENGTKPVSDGIMGRDVVRILEASDLSMKLGGKHIEVRTMQEV